MYNPWSSDFTQCTIIIINIIIITAWLPKHWLKWFFFFLIWLMPIKRIQICMSCLLLGRLQDNVLQQAPVWQWHLFSSVGLFLHFASEKKVTWQTDCRHGFLSAALFYTGDTWFHRCSFLRVRYPFWRPFFVFAYQKINLQNKIYFNTTTFHSHHMTEQTIFRIASMFMTRAK